ncbi:DJ-1 [Mycena floridula]|nr:DJ-1 [Mycena floridula]
MAPSVLILIADGTEEMEFTITYDTLVRAGITCQSAFVSESNAATCVNPPFAKCSRGINIMPDLYLGANSCGPERYDALVIPGGAKGADTISQNVAVQQLIRSFIAQKKVVGMICAGSLAALTSNLPKQPLTSHPSVKSRLEAAFIYSEDPVVISENLVTSRGPGTTFPFAFALIELLCGAAKCAEVRGPMAFPDNNT